MPMDESVVMAIDVGTTKICTLVARLEPGGQVHILGAGVEPSLGVRKGVVVDLRAAAQAIGRSIDKAERTSGLEIHSALVSLAGSQVSSVNNRGVVGISGGVVDEEDVARAIESARAIPLPHNREIVHVVQRGFNIDGQDGIRTPLGMHGYRLEVETHIIMAAAGTIENLRQGMAEAGIAVTQFVLNPLAAGEAVLTDTERQMGVVVCDIGGGTTDFALYTQGDVWHTAVFPVGGQYVTSDIAHGLRLPVEQAEEIKKQHGHALEKEIAAGEAFQVRPFGQDQPVEVQRAELAHIIEARMEEIFELVGQEIKRSGYDGLLPAGVVLTGGATLLPGIRNLAARVLNLPVRLAKPEKLTGMVDKLQSPVYSTAVGLVRWSTLMGEFPLQGRGKSSSTGDGNTNWARVKDILRRLLP